MSLTGKQIITMEISPKRSKNNQAVYRKKDISSKIMQKNVAWRLVVFKKELFIQG